MGLTRMLPMLKSLRLRVALSFGLGTLAVVVALSAALGVTASRRSLHEQSDTVQTLARSTATVLADGLYERLHEVELLAAAPPRGGLQAWIPVLQRVQHSRSHVSWMGVGSVDGRVQAATDSLLVGADVAARPWFQAALQGPHVGDVHAAKLLARLLPPGSDGEPQRFIDFAAPVRNDSGQVLAVLGVHTNWDWATEVINSLRGNLAREQGVRVFIFDRRGQLIRTPQGVSLSAPTVALTSLPKLGAQVMTWDDGERYLTASWPLPARLAATDLGWTVVTRQPLDQALAGVYAARNTALGMGALAVVLAALLAWWMAERFSAPLARVAAAARAVQAGRLDTEIPLLPGSRELEGLSSALRGMTAALLQREQELAAANQGLEQRVQERTSELMRTQAALQHANEELLTLASRDGLTGLLNRRAGDERLRQEMARHRRTGQSLALAIADIDHFKAVNDTHGHGVGDEVLRDVAQLLSAAGRVTDVVIRLGGEEFLVLMPDTSPEGARVACDKLRLAVAAHRGRVPVTLSLGVAAPAQAYGLAEAALEAADQALYAAKRAGRNRVVLANTAEAGPVIVSTPGHSAQTVAETTLV
jgi:diguanylate cyclase (GGDEF)-like protein